MQHECTSLEFLQGIMQLLHRTRPGATTGYMRPRTLKLKSPMIWCSISSDNHIRRGNCKGTGLCCTETVSKTDVVSEGKGEKKEINELDVVNIQHLSLNYMAQLAKLCLSFCTKGGLNQKGHSMTDCNSLHLYQSISQLLYLKMFVRW